jgi:hypothetical protein
LQDIQALLTFNGFENIKRQDYFNKEYTLVLEDMHDENVISRQGVLFFIDRILRDHTTNEKLFQIIN